MAIAHILGAIVDRHFETVSAFWLSKILAVALSIVQCLPNNIIIILLVASVVRILDCSVVISVIKADIGVTLREWARFLGFHEASLDLDVSTAEWACCILVRVLVGPGVVSSVLLLALILLKLVDFEDWDLLVNLVLA